MTPSKTDWKLFQEILPEIRERYLKEKNGEIVSLLRDSTITSTERFWLAEAGIRREAKRLRDCFDNYTKGTMGMKVLMLYNEGIFRQEDIEKFSKEFQKWFLAVTNR
jgi:hypothetical protein